MPAGEKARRKRRPYCPNPMGNWYARVSGHMARAEAPHYSHAPPSAIIALLPPRKRPAAYRISILSVNRPMIPVSLQDLSSTSIQEVRRTKRWLAGVLLAGLFAWPA